MDEAQSLNAEVAQPLLSDYTCGEGACVPEEITEVVGALPTARKNR